MKDNKIYEFKWLQPINNLGTNTTYEPTIEYYTQNQAKKKGLTFCLQETKRIKLTGSSTLIEIYNLISFCQVNLKKIKPGKEDKEDIVFRDLVSPYIDRMLVKHKMKWSNRQYGIYFNKREEAKVDPPNDILNKDNKKASIWWNIRFEINALYNVKTHKALKDFIQALETYKQNFFNLSDSQKEKILLADPKATFPENEMPNTILDYYDMEAILLNKENTLRGPWYYPSLKEIEKKQIKHIQPHELSFMPAHGFSLDMVRYKGLYYGYYNVLYNLDHKGNELSGLTREQTVHEIKTRQVLGKSFVADCFPNMTNTQIQEHCLDRLDQLDKTNYTNNTQYCFYDSIRFCEEHGLNEVAKFIVQNYPDRAIVEKYLSKGFFSFWLPIGEYIRKGNMDMVRFFIEQGADFTEHNYYLVQLAAKENQFEIFKYLFPIYKNKMFYSVPTIDTELTDKLAEEGYLDILDYLAQHGVFCDNINDNKTQNIEDFDKEFANMCIRHKKIYSAHKKAQKAIEDEKEKARKQKQLEAEKQRKNILITNLSSSTKSLKNKIKNLSSHDLTKLEDILTDK